MTSVTLSIAWVEPPITAFHASGELVAECNVAGTSVTLQFEHRDMTNSNSELANAFPTVVRKEALGMLARFPELPERAYSDAFSVRVAGETVTIPVSVYNDPASIETLQLSGLQKELADCLLTRHHNGVVRQNYLERIICSENVWITPFVVQLIGEYVIEILNVIDSNLGNLNPSVYAQFVATNPEFMALTEQRVISYWNENYRRPVWGVEKFYERDEYVGFRLVRLLKSLGKNGSSV
jgi:hypothetical protein